MWLTHSRFSWLDLAFLYIGVRLALEVHMLVGIVFLFVAGIISVYIERAQRENREND